VNELEITKKLEAEELKKRILSTPSLVLLISDCIRLARKHKSEEMEKWLMNELYGYKLTEEFNNKNKGRKIEEVVNDLPNNPQYRILKVKFRFQFGNRFEELDYPIFWTKPTAELENVHNDLQEDGTNKVCIVKLPLDMFPEAAVLTMKKYIPNVTTIPTEISRNEIANCINDLRLKLHEFVDSC
jgi:AbiTii